MMITTKIIADIAPFFSGSFVIAYVSEGRLRALFYAQSKSKSDAFGALGAGTDGAQEIEAVDPSGVAIRVVDLDGVTSDRFGGACFHSLFEHGKQRYPLRFILIFFYALVVADGAGAVFAQVGKIIGAGVAVGPDDFNALVRGDVYFYLRWFPLQFAGCSHD